MQINFPKIFAKNNLNSEKNLLAELDNWAESLYELSFGEQPLRGAIFTLEQLEMHAKTLAENHIISPKSGKDDLLKRLAESRKIIAQSHDLMAAAYASGRRLEPAAEWLLDNHYLVEEHFHLTRRHFPRSYRRQLPTLKGGEFAGIPRIYHLVLQFISHVDGLVDEEALSRYITAYQSVSHLTLGELWSVAIMLRLGLIENLRRVVISISWQRAHRDNALKWARIINEAGDKQNSSLILVLADLVRENPPLSTPFVSQFTQALQGRGATTTFMIAWLEQRLSEQGQTLEEVVRAESQSQTADQESMANSIASLRFVGATDWHTFVEEHSITEGILNKDPGDTYPQMDFISRDTYRHVVEEISRKMQVPEENVAKMAVSLAAQNFKIEQENATAHVGYYLIDAGRKKLEINLAGKKVFCLRTINSYPKLNFLIYMLSTSILLVYFLTPFRTLAAEAPRQIEMLLIICAVIFLSQMAFKVINWIISSIINPHPLPRMNFENGVPDSFRTMVVVPTMLTGHNSIPALIEEVELRFIANRDPNIWFALLTDFADAQTEKALTDEKLLAQAIEGVEELNNKYTSGTPGHFFLFHRPRLYNKVEGCWMGRERKRGKLEDFNNLICGEDKGSFSAIVGNTAELSSIKYVITLDTDTKLPWGQAWRLIGTAAHPLCRPYLNEAKNRISSGYVILQPRVSVSLRSAQQSRFSKLLAGEVGLDPYTRVVSDLYQDVFNEASFIGKGIYDVRMFRKILDKRFPDNSVLSHDLLESCYAKTGLCSDVELLEDAPSRYLADTARRHRWMRGDWQLLPWLGFSVRNMAGYRISPKLSLLGYWKILDNLRRALVNPACLLMLTIGWITLSSPLIWTIWILCFLFLPELLPSVSEIFRRPSSSSLSLFFAEVGRSTLRRLGLVFVELIFLPFETAVTLNAMLRTLWRMLISRRKMLEWQTAAAAESKSSSAMSGIVKRMWPVSGLAFAILVFLFSFEGYISLAALSPLLLAWFLSPVFAWWISLPLRKISKPLNSVDSHFIRYIARLTWRYFEDFVTLQENWLPPDNFQQTPHVIAHRTSPTNIGMSLLANLSAYDLGYLTTVQLLDRTQHTLESMEQLERYRGHFLNWYDTRSRKPLRPMYVSTVDSGNLVGHLRVLRTGLLELKNAPQLPHNYFDGMRDTFYVLSELIKPLRTSGMRKHSDKSHKHCDEYAFNIIAELLQEGEKNISAISLVTSHNWFQKLNEAALDFAGSIDRLRNPEAAWWAHALQRHVQSAIDILAVEQTSEQLAMRCQQIDNLAQRCLELANADFSFLYSKTRKLLVIGYSVTDRRLDNSYYDLLASEARLASFINIATGHLPVEHWFALGRRMTNAAGKHMLLSWSGSMFEFLMPLLVMPDYEGTLLENSHQGAVARQIEYGRHRNIPWGISESCYNTTDADGNYQYRAFGVPGLGLQRGLSDDLVIAPYASALALLVDPQKACNNLRHMSDELYLGTYGFYESIDYTHSRLQHNEKNAVVKTFMAHHHGMSLLSFAHVLLGPLMQKRFLNNPDFRAASILLQEKLPKGSLLMHPFANETNDARFRMLEQGRELCMRVFVTPNSPIPEVNLLSNGRYQVMVTASGSGYSRWNELSVTRWREDITLESQGVFCYIADSKTNRFWTNSFQPSLRAGNHYEAIFTPGKAEFRRQDEKIETHTEISVSPEDDVEIRRYTLTNRSGINRALTFTSYTEPVLALGVADELHRVFSNLFVQTEIIPEYNAILITRRPRSADERPAWLFCTLQSKGAGKHVCSYETDRAKFIGRGHSLKNPQALSASNSLSNTSGAVLDPCLAIRRDIDLPIDRIIHLDLVIGASSTREDALALVMKYQDHRMSDRVFEVSATHSRAVHGHLGTTEAESQLFQELAAAVVFSVGAFRVPMGVMRRNRKGQSSLWAYSISGDFPIVLLRVTDTSNMKLVRELLMAHAFWRAKGLITDLVIWNEDASGYRQDLNDQIYSLISSGTESQLVDKPGGIFVRHTDIFPEEDRVLLQAVARIVIHDVDGPLKQQLERWRKTAIPNRGLLHIAMQHNPSGQDSGNYPPKRDLIFHNGTGGFTQDGREYIIELPPGKNTPAPWVNVIAGPRLGTIVSESGSSYTWFTNAQLYRLTPWYNDPVCDPGGEFLYIRDEATGRFFSSTPSPTPRRTSYVCRHGFGYSVFEHAEFGLETELTSYVSISAPVKFMSLKIKNIASEARIVTVFALIELLLGDLRLRQAMHVVTELDPLTGAILARNSYNSEFPDTVTFFDCSETVRSVTCDRTEFYGRNGEASNPAALRLRKLSGRVGAGMDPCAAMQVRIELEADSERTVVFILGAGNNMLEALSLLQNFRGVASADVALEEVWRYWNEKLGVLHVDCPDSAVNILFNGWLPYQVLSSRIWGRSGFYQSGGAFGYRDQLQDCCALLHQAPELARQQIINSASRQFVEGDVQHWWHPPKGRGVRTRCSDDYLWLPYVVSEYVYFTGDTGILDEKVSYLTGRLLTDREESYYDLPGISEQVGSIYEHCTQAILYGLKLGVHGLPLMGSGDWNDGMDRVGRGGQGESVWLGFFLHFVLENFASLAIFKDDNAFAERCKLSAQEISANIEKECWDGEWYRRAFFDNGEALGSKENMECKIDSLPQSWATISSVGSPERAGLALDSAWKNLVNKELNIVQLFTPPFNISPQEPGYIKGYPPGIRENGGQYTHAAVWFAYALALAGRSEQAQTIFTMLNPITHTQNEAAVQRYKAEPYVLVADIYSEKPHAGQGGWSWYTGSAGWFYRLFHEVIFGLKREGEYLGFNPRVPSAWQNFKAHYRYFDTFYHINFTQNNSSNNLVQVKLDGQVQTGSKLKLINDKQEHVVEVYF